MKPIRDIAHGRRHLCRRLLAWGVVAIATGLLAVLPGLVPALLPEPDSSRLLFTELAEVHYRATSTPTVVKEYPDLRRLFSEEYNRRNARRGLLPVELPESRGLWSYSYVPGGMDLTVHGPDELRAADNGPGVFVTEPSGPPFVVWLYSTEENALCVFFFERFTYDIFEGRPPSPDPRIFLDYDPAGAVAQFGELPKERLIPTHAWLLSLGDVDARRFVLDDSPPRADVLEFIPTVVRVSAREEFERPVYSVAPLARVRDDARQPARTLRIVLAAVALAALTFAVRALISLGKLKRAHDVDVGPVSAVTFLTGDLEAIATRRRDEHRARSVAASSARREIEERSRFREEIAALGTRADDVLSTAELRDLRDRLVAEAESKAAHLARGEHARLERDREIHRLEVELAAIAHEAASDADHEARPSWELLERARAEDDLRKRLELLKEARRLLPRAYRPERF